MRQNAKAAADRDAEERHARIHRERRVREWTDREGAWNLSARGTTVDGARFHAGLERLIDEVFNAKRKEGVHEPRQAYGFDALMAMADGAAAANTKSTKAAFTAVLRADLDPLVRGYVEDGETVEIAGFGPIAVGAARQLLGESILHLVLTKGRDVVNVAHLGRGPSAAQRVALLWQMPTCTRDICFRRAFLEFDHRTPWPEVQETLLGNVDPLCETEHDLKTHHGWSLVEGTGKRAFVPPDDPRHPKNKPKEAAPLAV